MHEGKLQGHAVDEPLLAELTTWIPESGDGTTGVPRPDGVPEALNTKALYFAQGLVTDPRPNEVTRQVLARFWKTLEADQTELRKMGGVARDASAIFWPIGREHDRAGGTSLVACRGGGR